MLIDIVIIYVCFWFQSLRQPHDRMEGVFHPWYKRRCRISVSLDAPLAPRTLQHETHAAHSSPIFASSTKANLKVIVKSQQLCGKISWCFHRKPDVKMIFHMCTQHKTKGYHRQLPNDFLISGYFWWIFQHPATKTRGSPMKPPSPKPTGAPRWSQNPLRRLGFCIGFIHPYMTMSKMGKF